MNFGIAEVLAVALLAVIVYLAFSGGLAALLALVRRPAGLQATEHAELADEIDSLRIEVAALGRRLRAIEGGSPAREGEIAEIESDQEIEPDQEIESD